MFNRTDETKKNSVLIVDDEKNNIMVLTQILSPDYTIYAAKSGADAIEVANEYLPDVILLDIVMEGMDGYEVIAALKSVEKTREIPVIIISGLNEAKDEEKGLAIGASDYINKPFSPVIVKLKVKNQIKMLNYVETIRLLGLTDQLTELPNRRSFDERMSVEWSRAIREQKPISLMIVDIDKFKPYNDTYGHQQGDEALKAVAKIFSTEAKRSVDFVARYGGEEFVVLLSDTEKDIAYNVAERIRIDIENSHIPLGDGDAAGITVSIGINTLVPAPNSSSDILIKGADNALYAAKNSGRNKVCQYDPAKNGSDR